MTRLAEEEHPNKAFGWAAKNRSVTDVGFALARQQEKRMWLSRFFIVGYAIPIFIWLRMNGLIGQPKHYIGCKHEIVREVTEVGTKVQQFNVGDRVGVGCVVGSCHSYDSCKNNLENYCPKSIITYGTEYPDRSVTYRGCSHTMVTDEHFIVRIFDNLPLDATAHLLCVGIIVYNPLRYYGFDKPSLHIGVVGLGGLGHVC
ncbi:probable mannitol dehydrogenase [Gossypium arboreum]|uniref:probable mannitol dehydrogenase n=1 Tax=Gossypium arboreum TaxID=29729 RepID=UPI0008195905|nr:probable mannitol dehydrogenase [Gossypium arboreum]